MIDVSPLNGHIIVYCDICNKEETYFLRKGIVELLEDLKDNGWTRRVIKGKKENVTCHYCKECSEN